MDKSEIKEEIKTKIDSIFNQIDQLESKKNEVQEDSKKEIQETLDDLKARKTEIRNKYQQMLNASESQWEHARNDFSQSFDRFRTGVTHLTSIFSKN